MFSALLELLPDWVFPLVVGLATWFGINYAFIVPTIAERSAQAHCVLDAQTCQCYARVMAANARWEMALWTATAGLYDVQYNPAVKDASRKAREC